MNSFRHRSVCAHYSQSSNSLYCADAITVALEAHGFRPDLRAVEDDTLCRLH